MSSKPLLLFHGSSNYRESLEPKLAIGDGEMDNAFGIYAVEDKRIAQLFAIEYLSLSNEARFSIKFEDDFVYVELYQCSVNWDRLGYLYTLPSESFVKVDHMQSVSSESVFPTKVEPVNPYDFKAHIHQL
ncbi:hypothetical protein F2A31_05875 [Acinetobacter suaedae]|uniref:Uncharacterized protein n=1 Tax=Acinetobacter suaedae TaxID=2609668 RepID=A0A5P1URA7_9GAMM|nr:hypothetical protein [Acinetobacter sp. C16S1]QER39255.1 hypothetical protein F2A31_05875 [Acinetobacter sp. C16S1]